MYEALVGQRYDLGGAGNGLSLAQVDKAIPNGGGIVFLFSALRNSDEALPKGVGNEAFGVDISYRIYDFDPEEHWSSPGISSFRAEGVDSKVRSVVSIRLSMSTSTSRSRKSPLLPALG